MTRFSLAGGDVGGSSSHRPKKRRLVRTPFASSIAIAIRERERERRRQEFEESDQEEQLDCDQESEEEDDESEEEDALPTTTTSVAANASTSTVVVTDNRAISITLADTDVLDCPICCESLTIPVFQCENGHIACCSCCTKIKNKCPSCSWPIGYNRCRAIEKVLESVRMSCQNSKYGCKEWMTCTKKSEHEKACVHSPCFCPHLGCNFVSSTKKLYQHFNSDHVNSATQFVYNCPFSATISFDAKFLVLREKNDGILFILDSETEILGNMMKLSCIQPKFMGGFFYDLCAKKKGCLLRIQSFTNSTPSHVRSPTSSGSLIIPGDFFNSCGELKIDICIWRIGQCPASFQCIDLT